MKIRSWGDLANKWMKRGGREKEGGSREGGGGGGGVGGRENRNGICFFF